MIDLNTTTPILVHLRYCPTALKMSNMESVKSEDCTALLRYVVFGLHPLLHAKCGKSGHSNTLSGIQLKQL